MQAHTVKTAVTKLTNTLKNIIFNVNGQDFNAQKCLI